MAYYVLYQNVPTNEHGERAGVLTSFALLRHTHPVIWAARDIDPYGRHFYTRLLFWSEIPDEVLEHPDVLRAYGGGTITD